MNNSSELIAIRRLVPEEYAAAAEVIEGAFSSDYIPPAMYWDMNYDEVILSDLTQMESKNGISFGAFSGEWLVGAVISIRISPELREITVVGVHKNYRRRDIATRLCRAVEEAADEINILVITGSHNTATMKLYLEIGFREESQERDARGKGIDTIRYFLGTPPKPSRATDFSKLQLESILTAQRDGHPIEIECFNPYLCDYAGEFPKDRRDLTYQDVYEIGITERLHLFFPDARVISLIDEYNLAKGKQPSDRFVLAEFSRLQRDEFHGRVDHLLSFADSRLILRESEARPLVEALIRRLDALGLIREKESGTFFHRKGAETEEGEDFVLKRDDGSFSCPALDAAVYTKPGNENICHIVCLEKRMKPQQDRTWEILKAIGIRPNMFHNIFYDIDRPLDETLGELSEFFRGDQP